MGPLGSSVRALRPRCGHPEPDFPGVAQRTGRYAALSEALQRDGIAGAKCSEEQLSRLVCALRWFLDQRYGRLSDTAARKGMMVFPAAVFNDFSEFGALYTVLNALFRYMRDKGIDQLPFDDNSDDHCVAAVVAAKRALRDQNQDKVVKVFITPLVEEEEADQLRDILQNHGTAIVSNPTVATHVIYPDPDGTREYQTDGQVLVRVLEKPVLDSQEYCFVHWFHHPDSYNDWVPSNEVLGHVFIPRPRKAEEAWHIQARWVRDLQVHNEYMNELDYEMPTSFTEFVGQSPKLPIADTHGKPFSSLVRLRLRMPKPEEVQQREKEKENGGVRLVSSDNGGLVWKPNGKLTGGSGEGDGIGNGNGDQEMTDAIGLLGEDRMAREGEEGSHEKTGEDEQEGDAKDDTNSTMKIPIGNGAFLPYFTKWMNLDSVHDIEKSALPEFFEGKFPSKNENTYLEIRNHMIETWRKNPKQFLSGTAARRHLSGDACSILRVHGFLEHWGLINYEISILGAPPPSFAPPPRPLPLHAGVERGNAVTGTHTLFLDSASKAKVKGTLILKYGRNGEVQSKGSGRKEDVIIRDSERCGNPSAIAKTPEREPIEYHCDSCGVDCSQLRFHCATKADVDLCASCYHSAKYSAAMKPRDFIQMNSTGAHGDGDDEDPDVWTESETLLLLEALEMYGLNWTLVSEHVGSKGKSQCVIQFLRLPIEDSFLTSTTQQWWTVPPKGGVQEISPLEFMRKAGARESALAALTGKSPGSKQFSGQPLVYGDQISTIAAFATMLSSLSPPEIMNEIMTVMGISSSRKRKRDSFMSLTGFLRKRRKPEEQNKTLEPRLNEVPDEYLLTSRVYNELRKRIPQPDVILRTDAGEQVARGALSLTHHGAIPVLDVPKMQVATSPRTLLDLSKENGDAEILPNGIAAGGTQPSSRGLGRITLKNGQDVDCTSATAVAVSCLAAACVSASSRQQLEEAEIDRLHSLACELRMERIRKKISLFEAMIEHERYASAYRKRRRKVDIVEKVNRAKEMIVEPSDEVLAESGSIWMWGEEDSTAPSCFERMGRVIDTGEELSVRAAGESQCLEVPKAVLPDFSQEAALQGVKGMPADGEVGSVEEEDAGSDVAGTSPEVIGEAEDIVMAESPS